MRSYLACVVLIGNEWLGTADDLGQRRLDDPNDFVRMEVSTALCEGAFVLPVRIGEAGMPRPEQLPTPLRSSRRSMLAVSETMPGSTTSVGVRPFPADSCATDWTTYVRRTPRVAPDAYSRSATIIAGTEME